jgi:hypothetical protein
MSQSAEQEEVNRQDARRIVHLQTNQVYNPVLSTAEVAEELGVSEVKAYELLSEDSRVNEKDVGALSVWW